MTPGQGAYEIYRQTVGRAHESWEQIPGYHKGWEAVAAALAVKPEPEPVPGIYVDGLIQDAEVMHRQDDDGLTVRMTMAFPRAQRHHKAPGATGPMLNELLLAAQQSYSVVRLSVVSKAAVLNEFARLNPDGTVRQYASEDEGTW